MLGENDDRRQDRGRAIIERAQSAYRNTGRIRRSVSTILLVSAIAPLALLVKFSLYLWLIDYFFKPGKDETKLSAWPKNVIRVVLKALLVACIVASCMLSALPMLFLWLLNRALIEEARQFLNLMREVPEEERQPFLHGLVDVFPFVMQTTHDPSAVSSINLSVDKLIGKYRENLGREEFYIQLNSENTTDIVEYVRQSNEFEVDEKFQALECLKFIDEMGDSFKDNYSQLTLRQAAILCWKACNDRNTGMEDQIVPLSNKDIKNRKDMFVKGLVDSATTYGNPGQSCAGGTYNKLFESLAGLHPSVVITLDEKEASKMVEETITQGLPIMAREVLSKFPEGEQERIRKSFAGPSELSTETVMFITAVSEALEERCRKFSSKLDGDKQKEILRTCMSNLSYVELEENPNQMAK